MNKRQLGKEKENLAVNYLINRGYKIVKQNFFSKSGEIDIIAKKGNTLIFIEVRSKSYEDFGFPEETINKKKQRKIIKTALEFLRVYNEEFEEIRFDVISILKENIKHIENAFYLE